MRRYVARVALVLLAAAMVVGFGVAHLASTVSTGAPFGSSAVRAHDPVPAAAPAPVVEVEWATLHTRGSDQGLSLVAVLLAAIVLLAARRWCRVAGTSRRLRTSLRGLGSRSRAPPAFV